MRAATKRLATLALAPAIALATFAAPCDCPEHVGAAHGAGAHHADRTPPAAVAHDAHRSTASAPTGHFGASASVNATSSTAFTVGSAERPLVADGPEGPLWAATEPRPVGRTAHGTFAEQIVAEQIDAEQIDADQLSSGNPSAAPDAGERAVRASLSTQQATRQLSKRCQRLLKAKRPSKLSKADRKRRARCLSQRRALIAESKAPDASTGVTAPAPATPGPAPATGTTPGTAPASTPAPTPTPTPGTAPAGPVYAAVGVTAIDGDVLFQLTRAVATADIVNFELTNTDRQVHNLWIRATGKPETAKVIVADLEPAATGAAPSRANKNMTLAPGEYELVCVVAGHGPMTVPFTVVAPAR